MALIIFIGYSMPTSWYNEVEQSRLEYYPDGRIRYTEIGEGENALVFLHGFNSQIVVWDKVWVELNHCTHAIRLDIPGFGDSKWNTDTFDLITQSKRIRRFLHDRNVDGVILVGTSMGASLSVLIASQYPDLVRGLVLLAPSGYPGSLHRDLPLGYFVKPGFMNKIATHIANTSLYKLLFPRSIALQSLTTVSSYTDEWVHALEKIKAPTILMWSEGDEAVPYKFMKLIADKLTNKKVITLSRDVGHDGPNKAARDIAELACSMIIKDEATIQPD